ncbi:1302_t:CDS:2, partial [Gigaspora margarita]
MPKGNTRSKVEDLLQRITKNNMNAKKKHRRRSILKRSAENTKRSTENEIETHVCRPDLHIQS